MFNAGMASNEDAKNLRECLLNLPPLELLGMTLLRDSDHAGLLPADVPRQTLKDAVVEMIDYSERCRGAARRLSNLTPVPITGADLPEFAL